MSSLAAACARSSRSVISRHAARAFATESIASGPSTSVPDFPPVEDHSRQERRRHNTHNDDSKSVYVRTWDDIASMPEFFAILRGVERRFGTVRQFRVARDADITTKYHNFIVLDFAEDASFKRVPPGGTNIKVEVPVVNKDLPGGIGLAHLQGLLATQEHDPELDAGSESLYGNPISIVNPDPAKPESTRVVEVIVKPSKIGDAPPDAWSRSLFLNRGFGVGFFDWGGFYTPAAEDPRPVPTKMASALDKWREFALNDPRRQERLLRQNAEKQRDEDEVSPEEAAREEQEEADQKERERQEEERAAVEMLLKGAEEPVASPPETTTTTAVPQARVAAAPKQAKGREGAGPARLSRKEQILERARMHARMSAPEIQSEAEVGMKENRDVKDKANQTEAKETEEEVGTLRHRLLKLMGGRW